MQCISFISGKWFKSCIAVEDVECHKDYVINLLCAGFELM